MFIKHIQKEFKIVIVNITAAVLYLLISAALSIIKNGYTFTQGVYAWFITLTTIGLGDYVPAETQNAYTLLIGLCFMSALIDSLLTYMESSEQFSIGNCLRRCICCCSSKTYSVDHEEEQNRHNKCSMDVGTQTDEMMSYGRLLNEVAF